MRIRITDVDYGGPRDGDDLSLSYWGISLGDVFEVSRAGSDMSIIECDAGYVAVHSCECEVMED